MCGWVLALTVLSSQGGLAFLWALSVLSGRSDERICRPQGEPDWPCDPVLAPGHPAQLASPPGKKKGLAWTERPQDLEERCAEEVWDTAPRTVAPGRAGLPQGLGKAGGGGGPGCGVDPGDTEAKHLSPHGPSNMTWRPLPRAVSPECPPHPTSPHTELTSPPHTQRHSRRSECFTLLFTWASQPLVSDGRVL